MRQEASLNQWKKLFKLTAQIKEREPWNTFWDMDVMCVQLPHREEPVFCVVLGRLQECFGIVLYEGLDGLRDLNLLMSSQENALPMAYVAGEQTNLTCYWGDREEVPAKQKKMIKDCGLAFRGRGQWPYFISNAKRLAPYDPDAQEVDTLIAVYEGLLPLIDSVQEGRLRMDCENGVYPWSIFRKDLKKWETTTAPLPDAQWQYAQLVLEDEVLKKRLQRCKQVEAHLAIDLFYANVSVQDKELGRPTSPLMLAVVDVEDGMIVALEPLAYECNAAEGVLKYFIAFVEEQGRMLSIAARNPIVLGALQDICDYCDVELEYDELKEMDEIIQMLYENM